MQLKRLELKQGMRGIPYGKLKRGNRIEICIKRLQDQLVYGIEYYILVLQIFKK
jgi:hypothetical protein